MYINKIPSQEQKDAVKFILNTRKAIICYGTGSGKSIIMISGAILQMEHQDIDATIIVGTNEALKSIKGEMSETFNLKPITLQDFTNGVKGILLVPYQRVNDIIKDIPTNKQYTLILDEYHKVKSPSSLTTKSCNRLKKRCVNWYGFTATPVMKDFRDLYELVKWMKPLLLGSWENFCKNFTMFYTIPTGKFTVYKPYKFKNFQKLKRILDSIIITYFPDYDIEYIKIPCELEDLQGYKKVIKDSLTPTGDDKKDKALPMLAVKNSKYFVAISKNKLQRFLDTVRKVLNHGVIVYCDEYYTLDVVYKVLVNKNFKVLKYTGKQSSKLNDKSMEEFTKDPYNKVLLISRVASASLNLQATNRLIMFDMPSSIGSVQQLMGRVARKYSQYSSYFIYLMITEKTVEDYWYLWISSYAEPLKKLFNNGLVPQGIPTYNEFIKKKLINDNVWRK